MNTKRVPLTVLNYFFTSLLLAVSSCLDTVFSGPYKALGKRSYLQNISLQSTFWHIGSNFIKTMFNGPLVLLIRVQNADLKNVTSLFLYNYSTCSTS